MGTTPPKFRGRSLVITALVAIGLVAGLATATPSGAAPSAATATQPSPYAGKIGINADAFWLGENDAYNMFRQLTAIGVTQSREDIMWQHTEPTRGHFDWSRADNMFAAASRAGVEILGILDYSAPWASEVPGDTQYPPANNADFANFARKVVERYGPGGTFSALVERGPAIGDQVADWLVDLEGLHEQLAALPSPYGDGTASQQSVAALDRLLA